MSQDETKEALKEALKEWLDEQVARAGKWAISTVAGAILVALVSYAISKYGVTLR